MYRTRQIESLTAMACCLALATIFSGCQVKDGPKIDRSTILVDTVRFDAPAGECNGNARSLAKICEPNW